jgi:hypothetical protein
MTKECEYRENAVQTMLLARQLSSTSGKARLLKLAEAWLDLADRACRTARGLRWSGPVHPLIEQKLDSQIQK